LAPCARVAAEVLGWEGASPDAAADAAAVLRSPAVGWNSARAAELLVAMRAAAGPSATPRAISLTEDDDAWDVVNHVAPMSDRLLALHGWSPLEVCALLEELMVGRWAAAVQASWVCRFMAIRF
jgi:hypothetical protein